MKITPIKTDRIVLRDKSIFTILDKYLPRLGEKTVLVVTSKIISICEKRVVKNGTFERDDLIKGEADYYLPRRESKYRVMLTIKNNLLGTSAGIDESNGNGYYILWPAHPQKTANEIRAYLRKKFSLKNVGVIVTDSKSTAFRRGATGFALSNSGFSALNDYVGRFDVFRRKLRVTKANVADGLAAAAVAAMGEGNEQTPLALIEDVPFVRFQARNPSSREMKELSINPKDDLYASLLRGVSWRKGKKRRG